MVYLFLIEVLKFVILYSDISSRCPLIWGSISKIANIFWNILGSAYWLQSIRKSSTRNFGFLFVYFQICYLTQTCSFIINKITRNLNIFLSGKQMILFFLYFIFGLHFPETIIRVTDFFINKEICYSDDGLWKVKAKYKVKEK